MMSSRATVGNHTGLMAAPCGPPTTEHWFVGVGATDDYRTDLVLTNPDDGQAEVDLRFYGRNGLVVVPGSPGLVIEGRSSRTVSLRSLWSTSRDRSPSRSGPARAGCPRWRWTAAASTSSPAGRLAAQLGAAGHSLVIPASTRGRRQRTLVVANPGTRPRPRSRSSCSASRVRSRRRAPRRSRCRRRAPPTVDLAAGLAGQAGGVRLTSDQPVTGSVI